MATTIAGAPLRAQGRRPLDAAFNLVPFIDLLSCCIAFLLITAVWSAVARIDVAAGSGGERAAGGSPPWTLRVARDGLTLQSPDGAAAVVPPAGLTAALRAHAVVEPLLVRAVDDLPYATLVDALDRVRAAGIDTISVSGDDD